MREIKLRAWYPGYTAISDNETSIPPMMCDVVRFEKTSDYYDTYVLDSHKRTGSSLFAVPVYRVESDEQQSIIMQYTGIKDTNGKEIYEGDILKFETIVLISKTLGEIKEVAYAVVKWAHQGFALDCVSEVRLRTLSIDSGEVVGNIFENPELIAR